MIPTYNCASYLRESLAGLLAQDPGAELMQMEVVDDCSTKDDPKSVVEELGRGRVAFYQQPENVGYLKNFDTCLQRSRGKLVHILHGDDGVINGFYQKLQSAFDTHPEIGAAVCRHIYMDERGHWQSISPLEEPESQIYSNWMEQIAAKHRIQPPSIVVRREVYEKLGGFDHRICCACEDWEMWARIAANYPIWYEVEPLALYRKQSVSLTNRCIRTGNNLRDYRLVIDTIHDYLPKEHADRITQQSLEHNALCVIDIAHNFLRNGDVKTTLLQLKGALQLSHSPKVIYATLRLLSRFPLHGRLKMSWQHQTVA
jgi:glycosyltransferase involved in cell wall biosynthesis